MKQDEIKKAMVRIMQGEKVTLVIDPANWAQAQALFARLPANYRKRITLVQEA